MIPGILLPFILLFLDTLRPRVNACPNWVPLLLATPLLTHEKNWKCRDVQAPGVSVSTKISLNGPKAAGVSHDSPRTPNVHIRRSRRFKNTTKNPRQDPQRERGKNEYEGGRGKKKSEILGRRALWRRGGPVEVVRLGVVQGRVVRVGVVREWVVWVGGGPGGGGPGVGPGRVGPRRVGPRRVGAQT